MPVSVVVCLLLAAHCLGVLFGYAFGTYRAWREAGRFYGLSQGPRV